MSDLTDRAADGVYREAIVGDTSGQSGVVEAAASRLLVIARPLADRAVSAAGFFGGLSVASGLAGLVLWAVVFLPFGVVAVWKVLFAAGVGILLLAPGLVLLGFWTGLKQLSRLPDRVVEVSGLIESRGRGIVSAGMAADGDGGAVRRLLVFVRSLVDLRALLMDSRELMLQAAVLIRVANPVVLVAVLASTALAFLLVVAAIIAGAITAL